MKWTAPALSYCVIDKHGFISLMYIPLVSVRFVRHGIFHWQNALDSLCCAHQEKVQSLHALYSFTAHYHRENAKKQRYFTGDSQV